MKKRIINSQGFSIVELIIVIAIMAVLTGICAPLFISKVEKSRESRDVANVRNAYTSVRAAAIDGVAEDNGVQIDGKGLFYTLVPLSQKIEDFQTKSIDIAGIDETDTQHWKDNPKPGGICKLTCDADGNVIIYWNGGKSYTSVAVAESAKEYEDAINAVLAAIYNNVVEGRLGDDKNHISYVLIRNGKVTAVSAYSDDKDMRGGSKSGVTADELQALNNAIQKSLEKTGYKLTTNTTERIFFDWSGNAISNVSKDGNYQGIGGQGASASLALVPTSGGKNISLQNRTGEWSLR